MVVCYIYNDCILYFIVNAAPASRAPAPAPSAIRSVRPVSAASVPRDGDMSRAQEDGDSSESEDSDVRPSTASTQPASRSLSPARAAAASNPREDDNSKSSEMTIEPCAPGSTTKRKGGYRPRTPKTAVLMTNKRRVSKDADTPGSKTAQRYKAVKNCELLAMLSDQDKKFGAASLSIFAVSTRWGNASARKDEPSTKYCADFGFSLVCVTFGR